VPVICPTCQIFRGLGPPRQAVFSSSVTRMLILAVAEPRDRAVNRQGSFNG
jgi:hypothetical protein